jgi:uncharacterized membrane protein
MRVVKAGLFRLMPFAIGALLVAGIVHLAIVLLMPQIASSHAGTRLAVQAQVKMMELLPPIRTGQETLPLPFADPALVTAICRFDLADGPVRLRVPVGEGFLSVTLLSSTGRVTLAVTDKAATRRILDILLVTAEQQRQLEAQDPDDEPVQEIRIRMVQLAGVALVRALATRQTDKDAMAAMLARAICKPE